MIRKLLVLLMVTPLLAQASQPVTWSLAGQWRVHDANDETFDGVNTPDRNWRAIQVPANWYSAGYDHQGALWYRHE
ncbi:glycoside hydrolase family 2, partial [Escherichia coli]|nr:glycoside hydrolase family 2 [Escherichia coli]